MKFSFQSYKLNFHNPSATSRGVLTSKKTYLVKIKLNDADETEYFGECGVFKGLSVDDRSDYEDKLYWVQKNLDIGEFELWESLREFPSIQFGIEQLFKILSNYKNKKIEDAFNPILFPSKFTDGSLGISTNGLIWMGSIDFMKKQLKEKLNQNFQCIKLKIGVNWEEEKKLISELRKEYTSNELELRVDANGAFEYLKAKEILKELADLSIHSIEQPIKTNQLQEMADLCAITPTPVALDEELIGKFYANEKDHLLAMIQPQYIILKPSLVGGWRGSQEWIDAADKRKIGWWITSALESNIGLNAIAQWTFTLNNPLPQGLGTGGLFTNNFYSRLKMTNDKLFFV